MVAIGMGLSGIEPARSLKTNFLSTKALPTPISGQRLANSLGLFVGLKAAVKPGCSGLADHW